MVARSTQQHDAEIVIINVTENLINGLSANDKMVVQKASDPLGICLALTFNSAQAQQFARDHHFAPLMPFSACQQILDGFRSANLSYAVLGCDLPTISWQSLLGTEQGDMGAWRASTEYNEHAA